MPEWIQDLRNDLSIEILLIVDEVWKNREKFIHWPTQPLLFMPGTVRNTARFHEYNVDQLRELGAIGVTVDRRSNGPAIMAYLLAGGIRPRRANGRRCWSIHHIYDGQHPHPQRDTTIRAVAHGDHFTQAAGLVAIHPVADALADELPYFAWLLRHEAFKRFKFDPDRVFDSTAG